MKKAKKVSPRARTQKITHHVAHHAKRVVQITPKFVHGMFAGAFVGGLVVLAITAVKPTSALSIASSRDCSANAVLYCGALSTGELQQKYPQAGAANIYNYYGIDSNDINNIGTTAVAGQANKDGTVTVNGKVVATNASSTGRQKINGSHPINYGGMTFYETTNQAAFRGNSINAFVVMKNGAFDFAILGACGNPIKATSTTKPVVPVAPVAPTPTPTPKPTTPVVTPIPAPVAPPVVVEATATKPVELPNTGPGAIIAIVALAMIGGYIFHITHRHHSIKRHAKRAAPRTHKAHHA